MEKGIGILKINLRKLKEEFGKAQLERLPESCKLSDMLVAIRADEFLEIIEALEEAKAIILDRIRPRHINGINIPNCSLKSYHSDVIAFLERFGDETTTD